MGNNYECEIQKIDNGYIVKFDGIDGDRVEVVEEKDNPVSDIEEIKAMVNLLNTIKNYFEFQYSKHNENNIIIDIENTKPNKESGFNAIIS